MPATAETHTVAAVVNPCTLWPRSPWTRADESDPGDEALDDPAGRRKLITASPGF